MPTTYPQYTAPMNYRRPRWRRIVVVLVVLALICGGLAYAGFRIYKSVSTALIVPGCQAGSGTSALPVDPDQAPIAATVAGVAARMGLPLRALEIGYATALQESKLTNPTYGDRDSVGVFQQRPSEGWGTAAELENPEYATTAFFSALVKVPNYLNIPIDQAAQDVQHSADGSAYSQWDDTAEFLATSYVTTPHAVTCWYTPAAHAKASLASAGTGLVDVFGPTGSASAGAVLQSVSSGRSGLEVQVRPQNGWAVANWLMSNASTYGLTKVSYDGWEWSASLTETSWQATPSGSTGSILAS
ncbi:MAG TPA: hypothetical protein VMG38_08395 [Trebonia sp.]|nr:hypothetical protein [Trebonia sp.]